MRTREKKSGKKSRKKMSTREKSRGKNEYGGKKAERGQNVRGDLKLKA